MSALANSVEQAIRVSHCSNKEEGAHACIGVCTITPTGIKLDCTKCGSDTLKNHDPNLWLHDRAVRIFSAAGIEFENLAESIQAKVLAALASDFCPGCKQIVIHSLKYPTFYECTCGWRWSPNQGWKRS